jgi:hypothetical protein
MICTSGDYASYIEVLKRHRVKLPVGLGFRG